MNRNHSTLPGLLVVLALSTGFLLAATGTSPVGNIMREDINANGNSLTNAATVRAAHFYGDGSGLTNLPGSTGSLQATNNLADLASPATSRTNLGLATVASSGSAADLATGTLPFARIATGTSGSTVAIGNDTRFPASVTGIRLGAGAGSSDTALTIGNGLTYATGTLSANVTTVAGRTGAVTLAYGDISGLGTAATNAASAFDAAGAASTAQAASLQKSSNLSDLANAATARANLGLSGSVTNAGSGTVDLSFYSPSQSPAAVSGGYAPFIQSASNYVLWLRSIAATTGPITYTTFDGKTALRKLTLPNGSNLYTGSNFVDPCVAHAGGIYYMAWNIGTGTPTSIGMAWSPDMQHWTSITTPDWTAYLGGGAASPSLFFQDPASGQWYIYFDGYAGGAAANTVYRATVSFAKGSTTFGTPAAVTLGSTRDHNAICGGALISGTYYWMFQNYGPSGYASGHKNIELWSSSSPTGTYSYVGNWWGNSVEAPSSPVVLPDGSIAVYYTDYGGGNVYISTTTLANIASSWGAGSTLLSGTDWDWVCVMPANTTQSAAVLQTIQQGAFPSVVNTWTAQQNFIGQTSAVFSDASPITLPFTPGYGPASWGANGNWNIGVASATAANSPALIFYRSEGTPTSLGTLASGDVIGAVMGRGYYTGAFPSSSNVGIRYFAHQSFTSSAQGTYITLEATPDGSTTRSTVAFVNGDGSVNIGAQSYAGAGTLTATNVLLSGSIQTPIYPTTYLASFRTMNVGADANPLFFTSPDATKFSPLNGNSFLFSASNVVAHDPRILKVGSTYYLSYSATVSSVLAKYIGLAMSKDLKTWTVLTTPDWSAYMSGSQNHVANGCWFVDPSTGNTWLYFSCYYSNGASSTATPYRVQFFPATNTFGTPTAVTLGTAETYCTIMGARVISGTYQYLAQTFGASGTGQYVEYLTSSSISGSLTLAGANNFASWGSAIEGGSWVLLPNGNTRVYFVTYGGGGVYYSDSSGTNMTGTWTAPVSVFPSYSPTFFKFDWVDIAPLADIQSDQVLNSLQRGQSDTTNPLSINGGFNISDTATVPSLLTGVYTLGPGTIVTANSGSSSGWAEWIASSTSPPSIQGWRSRGTTASPSAVQSGDLLVSFGGRGYNGSDFTTTDSSLQFIAHQNFATGTEGTYAAIGTIPDGSITKTNQFFFNGDGSLNVGIQSYAGSGVLTTASDASIGGNLIATTAGKGLQVKSGTNARMGLATLVGGTVTVSNTSLASGDMIVLGRHTPGGTPGTLDISARTDGTSFTITSASGSDTSTVNWLLVKQN